MSRKAAIVVTRIAVIVAAIAALEILCRVKLISPLTLIPPSQMVAVLWELLVSGKITDDIVQTFSTVALAFLLSVAAGFALGALIHALPRVRRALDPLLASYYAIPFFVFYPLLIALFGLNKIPLVVIGLVFATAAMVIATLNGLDRVPRVMQKTARVMRLSGARAVLAITLPSAAPYLFTGLKLALAYAFIGVIAGEFILSGGGLGFSIAYAYNNFDSQTMYALMLFVLLVVTVVNGVLHVIEQRMLARRAGR
ncbi:MAG TPA: ABC transporter permease subunit [Xanthobacteraceae bacterium]|nr:ABC transporter permease subunit [Xanthobacteraceae bacterium]